MSNIRHSYCNMEFSPELSHDDFYFHKSIADLETSCKNNKEKVIKIRTIGALESNNGNFLIRDVDYVDENSPKILVSMVYLKSSFQSSTMPQTVQIFGIMQWITRPVIFAKIIQVLNATTALRLSEVMRSICNNHLAVLKTSE